MINRKSDFSFRNIDEINKIIKDFEWKRSGKEIDEISELKIKLISDSLINSIFYIYLTFTHYYPVFTVHYCPVCPLKALGHLWLSFWAVWEGSTVKRRANVSYLFIYLFI